MQIVIPMSGFGERFRNAGYTVPKPLIEVDGKPIIEHVVEMFPGEHDFIFIVNQDHLSSGDLNLESTLRRIAPKCRIYPIAPHKLGPINAVAQVFHVLDPEKETIVNYCDFTCLWDWENFKKFVRENELKGALPAYKGFHPHSLGTTNYAYIRETHGIASDIQEKSPFTQNRMQEYASSGTYYFQTGALAIAAMKFAMDEGLAVNGEFYVSLAYKYLFKNDLPTAVYPLQHFMQWGTPEDLHEYQNWSKTFRLLGSPDKRKFAVAHELLMPMAGLGKRFSDSGYETPKPLIKVSGASMVVRSVQALPHAKCNNFVIRLDMEGSSEVSKELAGKFENVQITTIAGVNDGQARSVETALNNSDETCDCAVVVGACDNASLYSELLYEQLLTNSDVDVVAWVTRGHAGAVRNPEMFGWVIEHEGLVQGVSVKKPLNNPRADPIFIGTMTFRNKQVLKKCLDSLFARDAKINGEFYLDSTIQDALDLGFSVRIFEVDSYISWGTPNEFETFIYWQSCFSKWEYHTYELSKDPWITDANRLQGENFRAIPPFLPRIEMGKVLEK